MNSSWRNLGIISEVSLVEFLGKFVEGALDKSLEDFVSVELVRIVEDMNP